MSDWFKTNMPISYAAWENFKFHRSYMKALKSASVLGDHLVKEQELGLALEVASVIRRMTTTKRDFVSYGGVVRSQEYMWRNRYQPTAVTEPSVVSPEKPNG